MASNVRNLPRAVAAGLVLFAAGLIFIAVDVLPFLWNSSSDRDRPLWLNLACLLAPIGFAVAVAAGLRAGREQQRAALRDVSGSEPTP